MKSKWWRDEGEKKIQDLQKQIKDLGLSLAFTIQAADILAQNEITMATKIQQLESALANAQEEIRILQVNHGS